MVYHYGSELKEFVNKVEKTYIQLQKRAFQAGTGGVFTTGTKTGQEPKSYGLSNRIKRRLEKETRQYFKENPLLDRFNFYHEDEPRNSIANKIALKLCDFGLRREGRKDIRKNRRMHLFFDIPVLGQISQLSFEAIILKRANKAVPDYDSNKEAISASIKDSFRQGYATLGASPPPYSPQLLLEQQPPPAYTPQQTSWALTVAGPTNNPQFADRSP